MRLLFVIIALLLTDSIRSGNIEPTVIDTIHLEGVTLVSDYKKFQPGVKIDHIGNEQLQLIPNGSLETALSRFTPIYVKGNAGGLSTIRFRGTAANHTSIQMGGININSLTLGHSNASNISLFLFDGLSLQYGSSATINGSGALGGTVYLEQNNNWTDGQRIHLSYTHGSFGERFYGTKIYVGNGGWESVTKLYLFELANNFRFDNPYHENYYTDPTPIRDTQKGAAIENKGVLQEINYRFNPSNKITNTIWVEDTWHQIQPNKPSNRSNTEELGNTNLRTWSQYNHSNQSYSINIGAGYVRDKQIHDNNVEQRISTNRLVSEGSISGKAFWNHEYKAGVKYRFIKPDVYAYSKETIEKEQNTDLYLSYMLEPIHNLKATFNLRQSYVSNFKAPLTPALITEYKVLRNEASLLSVNASVARSYRVPTFNDRYWGNQGNPDLKPEDGLNLEGGLTYFYQKEVNHYKAKINLFYMDIDNWIEWRLIDVWRAQNVQRVISKGAELQFSTQITTGAVKSELSLNYTYNPVRIKQNSINTTVRDQQMNYSPLHMGSVFYQLSWERLKVFSDITYTGERTVSDAANNLPSYLLTNLGLVRPLKFYGHQLQLTGQVRNLLNISYENENEYAMPGRSYHLTVSVNLNFLNQ